MLLHILNGRKVNKKILRLTIFLGNVLNLLVYVLNKNFVLTKERRSNNQYLQQNHIKRTSYLSISLFLNFLIQSIFFIVLPSLLSSSTSSLSLYGLKEIAIIYHHSNKKSEIQATTQIIVVFTLKSSFNVQFNVFEKF